MNYRQLLFYGTIFIFMALTSACSNSTDPGSDSTEAIKSVGVVSSVNNQQSLDVNGITYTTSDSTINNEEGGNLDVGMVVIVDGMMDEENHYGEAHKIHYEADIKGVVVANDVANSNTLNIMGQTIVVDDMTMYVSDNTNYPTLDTIPVNAYVEVSGFLHMDGTLKATRVELEAEAYEVGMMLKVKATITEVGDMYFITNGLTVMYNDNTDFIGFTKEDITAGLCVKVLSTQAFDADAMNLTADSIRLKRHGIDADHGDKVELYGEVTSDGVADNMFMLNDQPVMVTDATHYVHGTVDDIVMGAMLQAKGRMDENNVLVAEKIKFQRPHNVQIFGIVDAVNAEENYLQVMGAMVYVDNTTWMKDHPHYAPNHPQNPNTMPATNDMHAFGLGDIEPGNFVMIHGSYTAQQDMVLASKLQRKKPEHPAQVHVVGPVTVVDTENHFIVITGVKVDVSSFANLNVAIGDKASATGSYDAETMTLIPAEVEVEPSE
ncbi:DUF5666 domain-containing protein [Kaarinaea lacus]